VFSKLMIVLSTSFEGAGALIVGVTALIQGEANIENLDQLLHFNGSMAYVMLVSWLALGVLGMIVQYKFMPEENMRNKANEKAEKRA
ncbi:hypothetical protein ACFLU6_11410, partial [Acidobacteriota bacterium]